MLIRVLIASLAFLLLSGAAEAREHVVKKGESLYGIAKTYNLNPRVVISMNREIASQKYIFPGQVISLPDNDGMDAAVRYVRNNGGGMRLAVSHEPGFYLITRPAHILSEKNIGSAPLGRKSDPKRAINGFGIPETWKTKALEAVAEHYNPSTGEWDDSTKTYLLKSGDTLNELNFRNYKVLRNGVKFVFKDPYYEYLTWVTGVDVTDWDGQPVILQIVYMAWCGNWGWRVLTPDIPPDKRLPPAEVFEPTPTPVPDIPYTEEPPISEAPPDKKSGLCLSAQSQLGGATFIDLLEDGKGWHGYADLTLWMQCEGKYRFGPTIHGAKGGGISEGYMYSWYEYYLGLAAEANLDKNLLVSGKAGIGKRYNEGYVDFYQSYQETNMFFFSSWFSYTDRRHFFEKWFPELEGGFSFNVPMGTPHHEHSWQRHKLAPDPMDMATYEFRFRPVIADFWLNEDFAISPWVNFGVTYEANGRAFYGLVMPGFKVLFRNDTIFNLGILGYRQQLNGNGKQLLPFEIWLKPEGIWSAWRSSQITEGKFEDRHVTLAKVDNKPEEIPADVNEVNIGQYPVNAEKSQALLASVNNDENRGTHFPSGGPRFDD